MRRPDRRPRRRPRERQTRRNDVEPVRRRRRGRRGRHPRLLRRPRGPRVRRRAALHRRAVLAGRHRPRHRRGRGVRRHPATRGGPLRRGRAWQWCSCSRPGRATSRGSPPSSGPGSSASWTSPPTRARIMLSTEAVGEPGETWRRGTRGSCRAGPCDAPRATTSCSTWRATTTTTSTPFEAVAHGSAEPVTVAYYGAAPVPGFGLAAAYTDQEFSVVAHRTGVGRPRGVR